MELIQVGERTYYIKNPTNIGIYKVDDENIYLIDSGNDKDAGKKILKIIEENNWKVKGIISTHSHADHVGGNKVIQDRTGCKIYANKVEKGITEYPILESSLLYGGYPMKELRNKFLMAQPSTVEDIENNLPQGLELIEIKGHFFDMIGIKTSDDVYFLGDSIFSEETINKYHIFFIYDVREYLNTLNFLETLNGKLYIASHIEAKENIKDLIKLNRDKIKEIIDKILDFCKNEKTTEEIIKYLFDEYNLVMNISQYVLNGSTIKSYLSYLKEEEKIDYIFKDNTLYWKSTKVDGALHG